jgi:hypothetical protein
MALVVKSRYMFTNNCAEIPEDILDDRQPQVGCDVFLCRTPPGWLNEYV